MVTIVIVIVIICISVFLFFVVRQMKETFSVLSFANGRYELRFDEFKGGTELSKSEVKDMSTFAEQRKDCELIIRKNKLIGIKAFEKDCEDFLNKFCLEWDENYFKNGIEYIEKIRAQKGIKDTLSANFCKYRFGGPPRPIWREQLRIIKKGEKELKAYKK